MSKSVVWPNLKRFNTIAALKKRAEELYKDRPTIQERWVAAVVYLRNHTKKGWVGDEKITPQTAPPAVVRFRR